MNKVTKKTKQKNSYPDPLIPRPILEIFDMNQEIQLDTTKTEPTIQFNSAKHPKSSEVKTLKINS